MVADADPKASPLIALCAGGIAGGVEAACTYPFELAKTRVQLYGHGGVRNPFRVVANVARDEGVRALYKGCSTLIVGSIGKDAVRFLAFDSIRSLFQDPTTGLLTPAQSIMSGMLTGIVASTVIVTPTERVRIALVDDAKTAQRFRTTADCIRHLIRDQGGSLRRALYAGYVTTTLKQVGTTGFRLGSYSIIKDWERGHGIDVSRADVSFANGAVAGTITTIGTQPFDTVKTRAQQARVVGTWESVVSIYREDGFFRGFWRGTVMRLGRTVLAGGILFTANEQALKVLKLLTGKDTLA